MKVEIENIAEAETLSREAVRQELADAGLDPDAVSMLGYENEKDAVARVPADKVVRGNGRAALRNRTDGLDFKAKKPDWLRVRAPQDPQYFELKDRVEKLKLHTVCQEAACPNIGDCWASGHLTLMILGDTCTRGCAFCNIKTGKPNPVNPDEPRHLGDMAADLKIKHMVITSVDRDDLADGGAQHWADCVQQVREKSPETTIEILTPDFRRKEDCIDIVADSMPDVFNHNLETIPRLYREVRPGARYFGSLRLLQRVKDRHPDMYTKSGLMLGLGETKDEVLQVMDDMRAAGVDFLTLGQYLRPTPSHYPMKAFITPEEFEEYERQAKRRGFLMVASGALVRSSFHADKFFEEMVKNKKAQS